MSDDSRATVSDLIHHMLFPQNLHVNLKRDHKLKHWGRLQYGLFLKGAVSYVYCHSMLTLNSRPLI
jgi:hypothetical protein